MSKNTISKDIKKKELEKSIIIAIVDLYIATGKSIGSNTLKEFGFKRLSSATIRNYFAKLETDGFLIQMHSSGGRIPTNLAYKFYINHLVIRKASIEKEKKLLKEKLYEETKAINSYIQKSAEIISNTTNCAVFISSPKFNQDFILNIKLLEIDVDRCLCIIITDFGMIKNEILYLEKKLTGFSLKRIEDYLRFKIINTEKPTLNQDEEQIAEKFYKEVMLRHAMAYSNFDIDDVYKTGFSQFLNYSDMDYRTSLASGLSLFENDKDIKKLINICKEENKTLFIIGDEFPQISTKLIGCSLLMIPYKILNTTVGTIAILGPNRIPYKKLFSILRASSELISENLTKNLYKFKISFRQPETITKLIDSKEFLLLENKTEKKLLKLNKGINNGRSRKNKN